MSYNATNAAFLHKVFDTTDLNYNGQTTEPDEREQVRVNATGAAGNTFVQTVRRQDSYQYLLSALGTLVANVGSCGLPRDEGDLMACAVYDTATGECGLLYSAEIAINDAWNQYTVDWTSLTPPTVINTPFAPDQLMTIQFEVPAAAALDLWLDDVSFQ